MLVFDSGVGGLSIYTEMKQIMPDLHYIYVFDNVAFPYGEKSQEFIIKRVLEIVTIVKSQYHLTLAVIACNTASTVSLSILRKNFSFPIVGVVPAIKQATYLTTSGVIGILATQVTLKSFYTRELIVQFANKYKIEMLELTELVKLAEEKMRNKMISLKRLRLIFKPWLYTSKVPDTIVLGCTHFSLLKEELLNILPCGTHLVDSGVTVAHCVAQLLKYKTLNIKQNKANNAFCMTLNKKTECLLPTLNRYGFKTLKKLV